MTQAANTNLTQLMQQAEGIFENFDTATPAEQNKMAATLSEAFLRITESSKEQTLSPDLADHTARLLYLYGRYIYDGEKEQARQIFQLSLAIQCVGFKALKLDSLPSFTKCTKLEDLPKWLVDQKTTIDDLDKLLLSDDTESLAKAAAALGEKTAIQTAQTLTYLGFTYQNITKYQANLENQKIHQENFHRFQCIYGLALKILTPIKSIDSRWEECNIHYNTDRFLYNFHATDTVRKTEAHVSGAIALLDNIKEYTLAEPDSIRSRVRQAQIFNIKSVELANVERTAPTSTTGPEGLVALRTYKLLQAQDLYNQYSFLCKAVNIAEDTKNFPFFFKMLFQHNRARTSLECIKFGLPVVTLEKLGEWYKTLLTEMEDLHYNHTYHPYFLKAAAVYFNHIKNYTSALETVKKAIEVNNQFLSSNDDFVEPLATIQKQIEDEIAKSAKLTSNEKANPVQTGVEEKKQAK